MRPTLAAFAFALLPLASACHGGSGNINRHWSGESTVPRMSRFFLGYDAEKHGSYKDFQWERKQSINLTLRRHFLNHNPDNPNHAEVESRFEPRPNHSPLPNPLTYFHLEALLLFGIPVDSILGTLEPGGMAEFQAGVGEFVSPIGVIFTSLAQNVLEPTLGAPIKKLAEVLPERDLRPDDDDDDEDGGDSDGDGSESDE